MVREPFLEKGVDAPNLAIVKDFLRFYIVISRDKIVEKITNDSFNAVTKWFFAGFNRVTETPTDEEEKSEVYDVSY